MYSKQEAAQVRKNFWTSFGQYMRPLPGADGEPVNWLNYKTGFKHLYFRMDAGQQQASIAIEMRHPDPEQQASFFQKFAALKTIFHEALGETWNWEQHIIDEDGKQVSRIGTKLKGVNIFKTSDWPAIISFLKPRMIALDNFWSLAKERFY